MYSIYTPTTLSPFLLPPTPRAASPGVWGLAPMKKKKPKTPEFHHIFLILDLLPGFKS